jgi:hypothetical protein
MISKIKTFLDRPIVVDWAVPKDIYKSTQRNEIKPEADSEVKQESEDDSDEEKPKYAVPSL